MSQGLPNLRAGSFRSRIICRTVAGLQRSMVAASAAVRYSSAIGYSDIRGFPVTICIGRGGIYWPVVGVIAHLTMIARTYNAVASQPYVLNGRA